MKVVRGDIAHDDQQTGDFDVAGDAEIAIDDERGRRHEYGEVEVSGHDLDHVTEDVFGPIVDVGQALAREQGAHVVPRSDTSKHWVNGITGNFSRHFRTAPALV